MKENKEELAPNFIKMIRWTNHVVSWLVSEIVTVKESISKRTAMMEKIVLIAIVSWF